MIVGGSKLLETAIANSDLDIIFIIPEIYNKDSLKECNKCFNKSYSESNTRPCSEHDLIFGDNQLSLCSNLKKAIVNDEAIKEINVSLIK